jgi:hypothetical protein
MREEHLIALKKFFKYLYGKNYNYINNIISNCITTYPL